jgi:hypothetical protein
MYNNIGIFSRLPDRADVSSALAPVCTHEANWCLKRQRPHSYRNRTSMPLWSLRSWRVLRNLCRNAQRTTLHRGLPFHLPAECASVRMTRRRARARRLLRSRPRASLRLVASAASTIGWPLGALLETRALLRRSSHVQSIVHGRWSALSVLSKSVRHNFAPAEVVEYGLCVKDGACPDAWIGNLEILALWRSLRDPTAESIANDKHLFASHCAVEGLPHIETLGCWRGGHPTDRFDGPWPDEVVLKPVKSNNGLGFERWVRRDSVFRNGSLALDAHGLMERGKRFSATGQDYVAQPCLRLHRELVAHGLTGLPVARLITGRWPEGSIHLMDAYFVAPMVGRFPSNATMGFKWPVHASTGVIEPTLSRLMPVGPEAPQIVGVVLPDWEVAVAHVLRGHESFTGRVAALGWDVAFTDGGPILVEANVGFSLMVSQGVRQCPAGPGPVGDLVAAWLS